MSQQQPETRSEPELQLRDYLVTYGQCRALNMDPVEAFTWAEITRDGMAQVRDMVGMP